MDKETMLCFIINFQTINCYLLPTDAGKCGLFMNNSVVLIVKQ